MDDERYNVDRTWKDIRRRYERGFDIQWDEEMGRLKESLAVQKYDTEKRFIFLKIAKYFGDSKIRILDYGCGSGQLACYLQLLGYPDVCGVDVFSQVKNNHVLKLMGLQQNLQQYDGKSLPFKDESFGLVISEQVLEHVFDIESYYRETSRVLKRGGLAYFNFPHKFVPFDSHSRTWFIHIFPKSIKRFMYRMVGKDPRYYEKILNFQSARYHKRIASRYFTGVFDETKERLLSFDESDFQRYEGGIFLRRAADRAIKSKIGSQVILPALSRMSNLDLCLIKKE